MTLEPNVEETVAALLSGGRSASRALGRVCDPGSGNSFRDAVMDSLAEKAGQDTDGVRVAAVNALTEIIDKQRFLQAKIHGYLSTNNGDAEEVYQEALLIMVRDIDRFRSEGHFRSWLNGVATRLALRRIDQRRRERQGKEVEASELGRAVTSLSSLVTSQIYDQKLLAQMTPAFREVLLLADRDRLPYRTISERLAIPVSTVGTRLLRGRTEYLAIILSNPPTEGGAAR